MKKVFILLFIVLLIFGGCNVLNDDDKIDEKELPETEERDIILYFANSQAQLVVPEHRTIVVNKDISKEDYAKIILEELIKGPDSTNLYKTIPSQVKVLNVEIDKDTIYIDFSKEMQTEHWGGAAGEDMTISSIVNTLTELEGIKYVLPTVEGIAMNIEHLIIDKPLERMEDIIYKE